MSEKFRERVEGKNTIGILVVSSTMDLTLRKTLWLQIN